MAFWIFDKYEYAHCSHCGYEMDDPEDTRGTCPQCGCEMAEPPIHEDEIPPELEAAAKELDKAMTSFVQTVRSVMPEEWADEMARLREENAKYADIKARWAEIEAERQREHAEVERVKAEVESVKKNAKLQAQYARMAELWGNVCFERINRVNAFFKSRERCQAFCNWLNGEGDESGLEKEGE